jgi:hypothetical protein
MRIGRYFTLAEFCTCSQTYQRYAEQIDPYPQNLSETIPALVALCETILDPLIDKFGRDRIQLTYGFCSNDLRRFLERRDPETGRKHGRIYPPTDQHMGYERKRSGVYYCRKPGAACDFRGVGIPSDRLIDWIVAQLPFDSLYYYGCDRPIHISYGPQHRRAIWTFTAQGTPTQKGVEHWLGRQSAEPNLHRGAAPE